MRKIIVTVAPTGNVPLKKDNINVPITPEEIAEDIFSCYQVGAAIAHIHTRGADGNPVIIV